MKPQATVISTSNAAHAGVGLHSFQPHFMRTPNQSITATNVDERRSRQSPQRLSSRSHSTFRRTKHENRLLQSRRRLREAADRCCNAKPNALRPKTCRFTREHLRHGFLEHIRVLGLVLQDLLPRCEHVEGFLQLRCCRRPEARTVARLVAAAASSACAPVDDFKRRNGIDEFILGVLFERARELQLTQ